MWLNCVSDNERAKQELEQMTDSNTVKLCAHSKSMLVLIYNLYVWFQHILLQNGGKLHVKDIADGIVESGLVPPRLVYYTSHIKLCDHELFNCKLQTTLHYVPFI